MQVAIREDMELMGFDGMAQCCTIASKTMMFFQHQFLKQDTIGIIGQENLPGHRNQSREALLWLLQMEASHYPDMQHALSMQGEKSVLGYPVDGFHELTQTVLQFHGCFWHGCPSCFKIRSKTNSVNGKTFDELYATTLHRTKKLRDSGYHVIEKWECNYSEEEKRQAVNLESKVPQIIPKDAFYGGRTEAIRLHTQLNEKEIQNDEEILYYDVTSEYPFVNARKDYPLGLPKILLEHQLPQSNDTWKKKQYFGLVKCVVLPPSRLLHPLLPSRQNGMLMFALCAACCLNKLKKLCKHTDQERAIEGTWPTIEIDKALDLGYKLLRVKEVWNFEKRSSNLFTNFINALYKGKIEASGYPDNIISEDLYIKNIERHEGIKLDKDKIKFNAGKRQMCKILLNSFW